MNLTTFQFHVKNSDLQALRKNHDPVRCDNNCEEDLRFVETDENLDIEKQYVKLFEERKREIEQKGEQAGRDLFKEWQR